MDTIFLNSENSKISDPHRLLLNPSDKINLERNDKYVASLKISSYYTWKNTKQSYKNNQLKMSLNYLMDHILYQIFKITLSIS